MVAFHGGLQYAHSMASTFKTTHNGHEQYCMKWKQDGKWRYVYAYTRADLNNKHVIFIKNKHVMTYSYFNWIWHRIQRDYFNEIWNNKLTDDNYLKPHTTRHITASLMAYDGIPLSMAQTILGHMSAQMTQHYTHITATMKRETIERFTRDTAVQTMNNIVDETMKINNENKK